MSTEMCCCGKPLHYTDEGLKAMVDEMVKSLGENQKVTLGARSWLIPRHYIALHGLKGSEIESLAETYGWEEILLQ